MKIDEMTYDESTTTSSNTTLSDPKLSPPKFVIPRSSQSMFHTFQVKGHDFVLYKHYVPIKYIGAGAYGIVCVCEDQHSRDKVAIKKIQLGDNADAIFTKRNLRELKYLKSFHHDNIIGLRDVIVPVHFDEFKDLYLVLERMDSDLHKVIRKSDIVLESFHVKYIMYQLLCALKYIHSANVTHRDIKPSNLLISNNCKLNVCDFGLAKTLGNAYEEAYNTSSEDTQDLTEYVVTRWYRAPEIMVNCKDYTTKIDIWSAGCIFAELLTRKPLFPGDNYIHQLDLIFDFLGTPNMSSAGSGGLEWMSNSRAFEYVNSLPARYPIPFDILFPNTSKETLDLLKNLLTLNPAKRLSAVEALSHTYFDEVRDKSLESKSVCEFDVCQTLRYEDWMRLEEKKEIMHQIYNELVDFKAAVTTKFT